MKPRFSSAWTLVFAVALSLLQACTSIRHIRDAQDAFNQAARAELEQPADGNTASLIASPASSSYKVALGLVERELEHSADELAEDDLMGTALMLRALCAWRLWDLGEADATADSGGNLKPSAGLSDALAAIGEYGVDKLGTRDRVLYYALPGLHDHDRAMRAKDWLTARKLFESAVRVTGDALDSVNPPPNHPIRAYITLAQLSTCRAWQAAAFHSTSDSSEQSVRMKEPRDDFSARLEDVRAMWQDDTNFYGKIVILCNSMGVTAPGER